MFRRRLGFFRTSRMADYDSFLFTSDFEPPPFRVKLVRMKRPVTLAERNSASFGVCIPQV